MKTPGETQSRQSGKTSNLPPEIIEIRKGKWSEDAWMDFSRCEGIIKYVIREDADNNSNQPIPNTNH